MFVFSEDDKHVFPQDMFPPSPAVDAGEVMVAQRVHQPRS